jgi:Zn-dependent protease with chaperone function
MKERKLTPRLLALILAILIAEPAWLWGAVHTPELPNPGEVSVTKQQQEQLGLKATGEVYQQMPVLPDSSPVVKYIQQLGKKLDQVIPQQYNWPYQFHVIEQKEINAFALPGGPIFINVGTITAADNEAELAGVMAHEMSHVYMQHSIKGMQKQQMTQGIAGIVGAVLGSVIGGTAGSLANMGAQTAGGILSLKYSREDEAQADAVGAIILWKAGYDPKAMAEFFQKLEKEGGAGGPQFLSDHPNPGNRVEAVQNEIKDWPSKSYQNNSQAFTAAKQDATKVKAYSAQEIAQGAKSGAWARQNQQTGAVPRNVPVSATSPDGQGGQAPGNPNIGNVTYNQVKPSGSYKQYQQSGLSISYPSNWQVVGSQNGLTIAPQAGVSQGAVAYGVVMGAAQVPSGASLDQATQALVRNMEQSNPGLQASGSASNIQVNGRQGRSQMLTGNSPVQQNGQPMREQDWLVTVAGPNNQLVYLVFVAPQRDYKRLKSTYKRMLQSLQLQ